MTFFRVWAKHAFLNAASAAWSLLHAIPPPQITHTPDAVAAIDRASVASLWAIARGKTEARA